MRERNWRWKFARGLAYGLGLRAYGLGFRGLGFRGLGFNPKP